MPAKWRRSEKDLQGLPQHRLRGSASSRVLLSDLRHHDPHSSRDLLGRLGLPHQVDQARTHSSTSCSGSSSLSSRPSSVFSRAPPIGALPVEAQSTSPDSALETSRRPWGRAQVRLVRVRARDEWCKYTQDESTSPPRPTYLKVCP
jgi:hypothetical protein